MGLDNDFLDLKKQNHNSTFGIISVAIAILWLAIIFLPRFFGAHPFASISSLPIMGIQLMGVICAIISIRKKETRSVLYLIGLIINGTAFLFSLLNSIF